MNYNETPLVNVNGQHIDKNQFNIKERFPTIKDLAGRDAGHVYFQHPLAAFQYVYDVLYTNKYNTNRYIKMACNRFMQLANHPEIYFDVGAVQSFIDHCNSQTHYKGSASTLGQPILLAPFMIFVAANMLGWKFINDGSRVCAQMTYLVARGNAKSLMASCLASAGWLSLNSAQRSISVASTLDQGAITLIDFKNQKKRASPHYKYMYNDTNRYETEFIPSGKKYTAFSSSVSGANGQRNDIVVCDELAELNPLLMAVCESGTTSSDGAISLMISTAGHDPTSPAVIKRNAGRAALESGDNILSSIFYIEYSLEFELGDEWDDLNALRKSNPAMDIWISKRSMMANIEKARDDIVQKQEFITKQCNVFASIAPNPIVETVEFNLCAKPQTFNIYDLKESESIYIGLDCSQVGDIFAVVAVANKDMCPMYFESHNIPDDTIIVFPFGFLPRDTLDKHKLPIIVEKKYENWVLDDQLFITKGATVDPQEVIELIKSWMDIGINIKGIGYDPYWATIIVNALKEITFDSTEYKPINQNGVGMHPAVMALQSIVSNCRLAYDQSLTCFVEHVINTQIKVNEQSQLLKPIKSPSQGDYKKTDLCFALLDAVAMATDALVKPCAGNETYFIKL